MFALMKEHNVFFSRRNHCPSSRGLHCALGDVEGPQCAQAGGSYGAVQANAISLAPVKFFLQERHCWLIGDGFACPISSETKRNIVS